MQYELSEELLRNVVYLQGINYSYFLKKKTINTYFLIFLFIFQRCIKLIGIKTFSTSVVENTIMMLDRTSIFLSVTTENHYLFQQIMLS